MREQRIAELTTQVDTAVAAMKIWMQNQRVAAELVAQDEGLAPLVAELARQEQGTDSARELLGAKE